MGQNSEMTENACRLCDESGPSMHSVFERVPEGQQILQLIKDCLRILIYRTDPLPKQICQGCYTNLVNFSTFKRISLETLDRQKERLRECSSENNISVRLFLNALEQENCQLNENHNSKNSQQFGNEYLEDHKVADSNESELCAQLQKAIQESLRKSKLQENYIEQQQNLTNGHSELQDEDSQTSKELRCTDSPFSLSQNAESQSDMELCDSEPESSPKIITSNIMGKRLRMENHTQGPVLKKRRFVGPKSRVKERREHYMKILHQQECRKKVAIKYEPLSLMGCILNHINKENVPDYQCENYTKVEVTEYVTDAHNESESEDFVLREENICNYCEGVYVNVNSLALHESKHMYVVLGEKIDMPRLWNKEEVDASTRNKWYNSINSDEVTKPEKVIENFDDSTGRVNVIDPEDVEFKDPEEAMNDHQDLLVPRDTNVLKGEVVLIDTQATVNGVPLAEIPKDDRRTLYKSVTVNGVKRKFCPLCRYTFKDNWAIESHYFSTACHYTCRFCGVRFNKQRNEFDNHIKQHIMAGDVHTTKIFASRKFHSVPRVINENKMKARPPPTPRATSTPKIRPVKMKQLMERKPQHVEIKQEPKSESPLPGQEGIKTDGKQNQAYFCRKCYQVFFKLDEFNVHVVSCKGTAFTNNKVNVPTPPKQQHQQQLIRPKPEPEKFSPTGRPMRNCVKEIGTYADDVPEEVEMQQQIQKISIVKSSRGYECGMCSSCFPTVHSRNSHMRIHKAALHALSKKSVNISKSRPGNLARKVAGMVDRHSNIPTFAKYVNNVKIKQEPMEPIVEIHEQAGPNNFPSSIGSVSITPIPNSSQKTTLDPNIMKLVQNNPNLTIKTMVEQQMSMANNRSLPTVGMSTPDGDTKCYRCLSCSKPFANKSNLYFHKKNQCSGSKYPCPFCKKRFGTEAAYSSHIFYNHPE